MVKVVGELKGRVTNQLGTDRLGPDAWFGEPWGPLGDRLQGQLGLAARFPGLLEA